MSNEPWLIKNSTREERAKRIKGALVILTLDSKVPVEEDMKLYEKYIEGEMELEEIRKILIERYTVKEVQ